MQKTSRILVNWNARFDLPPLLFLYGLRIFQTLQIWKDVCILLATFVLFRRKRREERLSTYRGNQSIKHNLQFWQYIENIYSQREQCYRLPSWPVCDIFWLYNMYNQRDFCAMCLIAKIIIAIMVGNYE